MPVAKTNAINKEVDCLVISTVVSEGRMLFLCEKYRRVPFQANESSVL
jgi:hypothetical protein